MAVIIVELARLVANAGEAATARRITGSYENEPHADTVLSSLMQCDELSELLYDRFGAG